MKKKLAPGWKKITKNKAWMEHYDTPLSYEDVLKWLKEIYEEMPKDRVTKATWVTAPEIKKFPSLEEVQDSEWYKTRPEAVQKAIDSFPPIKYYKFKSSGKQCYIYSYSEHEDGPITVTVHKTGVGGSMASMGLGTLDTNSVFGVALDDLEPWTI